MRRSHKDILDGRTLFMMFLHPRCARRNSFRGRHLPAWRHGHFLSRMLTPAHLGRRGPGLRLRTHLRCRPVLSRMGDCIAIRIPGRQGRLDLRQEPEDHQDSPSGPRFPVINMGGQTHVPSLPGHGDVMTLREMYGRDLRGRKLAVTWTWGSSPKKPIAPHHDFMYAASFYGPEDRLRPTNRRCTSTPRWKPR